MAIGAADKGKLRVRAQSGWGTPVSAGAFSDLTDLLDCEFQIPELVREELRSKSFRAAPYAHRVQPGSKQGTKFTLKLTLQGHSATTPVADPTQHADGILFASLLGAASIGGYGVALETGGTTTVLNVTSATPAVIGGALAVPLASGHGIGWVKNKDTTPVPDTVTLEAALPSAPASSGTCLGALVYSGQPGVTRIPWSLQWLGADANSALRLWDCQVESMKCSTGPGGQPMLDVACIAGGWTIDGTGGAPGVYSLVYPALPAALGDNGGRFLDNGVALAAHKFEWEITSKVTPLGDYAGAQGLGQFVVAELAWSGKLTIPMTDAATQIDTIAALRGILQLDYCTTAGRMFSLLVPAATTQKLAPPKAEDVVTVEYALGAGAYVADGSSTAPGNTPFRAAFL